MTRFGVALCRRRHGYGVETAREPWERGHPARQRLRWQMRSASSWLRRFACAGHAPRLGGRAGCPRSQTDAPQRGLIGKRFPLPIRWGEGQGEGLRRRHGYGQVNPTQSDSIRPDLADSDRMRPDTDCKCTMVRAVERTFQSVFSIRPKTGMRPQGRSKIASSALQVDRVHVKRDKSPNTIHLGRNPVHAPFAVGKPQPICFHAPMAGGPTHSKFTIQGLVSGRKYWFRACALRGSGRSLWSGVIEKMAT